MNINTDAILENETTATEETAKFGLNIMMGVAALIGIWGMACLIGGLSTNGISGLIKGFLTAVGV